MSLEPGKQPPPIYIVSGATGASAEQLVYTILAQFPENQVPVIVMAHVRRVEQVERIVDHVAEDGGTIVHTMVEEHLRHALVRRAEEKRVAALDLRGDLIARLSAVLGRQPVGQPGLYRQLNQAYFERVSAIEYAMAHDDGQNPADWPLADVVLVGVSRVGKTPLSMLLAVLGLKTANVPLILNLPPPPELFALSPQRVVGLIMEPGQLVYHRQQRRQSLGVLRVDDYVNPAKIHEEMEAARAIMRRAGFSVIDVTDKPIETSANQIIELITRRFGDGMARSDMLR